MSSTDDQPDAVDDHPENSLEKAFARALNAELDRIGYPAVPARTNQLAIDLGVSRMQAYRIVRGDSLLKVKSMLRLQRIGVSFDAVLQQLPGPRPVVAVIEDDPGTLDVFCAELEPLFEAVPFRTARKLKADPAQLSEFDAVILDWVLPKADGSTLVSFIRSHTAAPIVVTTGHREQEPAISSVLGLADLYYVSKPVDGEILRAMVAAAINKRSPPSWSRPSA